MTSRNRFAALSMVVMMLATSLAVVMPTVQAQEDVPTKPGVILQPIPNLRQFVFMRFENITTENEASPVEGRRTPEPNCADAAARTMALDRSSAPTEVGGRPPCLFSAGVGGTAGDVVTFVSPSGLSPNRRVNFTGNNSFFFHHEGRIPEGVTVEVRVETEGQTIASGIITGDDETVHDVRLNLAGPQAFTGRVEMVPDRPFRVTLTASSPAASQDPLSGEIPGMPTWQVNDQNTFLEMRAENAVRAAMWITDERDVIRNVFAPIANESQRPEDRDKRIVGHFALQSAFGYQDASRGTPAQFSIIFDGRPREVGEGGTTLIEGVLNESASATGLGLAVWTFPYPMFNYRGYQSGEYTLHVEKNHHQGAPINRETDKTFSITSQSVQLSPFVDPRATSISESQSHTVLPGGSTTYILAVNNTGSVNDTFTINVTAPPNSPPGWGVAVGGPDVLSRRVLVPKGETRIFTVTVSAPFAGSGSVIHIVNVTSMLDPGARSPDMTLVTSVGQEAVRDVAVFVLQRELILDPGVETHIPVYVWNRGTRVANVSLSIEETPVAGWIADLAQGNDDVDRLVISGIQPGDIGQATLKMKGPTSTAISTHTITLNATNQDAPGIARDRSLTFSLRQTAGVTVQMLTAIGARQHVVEVVEDIWIRNPADGSIVNNQMDPRCDPNTPDDEELDCTDDGVDGIWWRVWVTNTGKVTDTFVLTGDAFEEARGEECNGPGGRSEVFVPNAAATDPMTGDFGFHYRSPSGVASGRNVVENLAPGRTAELYVFLPVDRFADLCLDDDRGEDFFSFVVQARGQNTGSIGRAAADAIARNNAGHNGLYLEGVVRDASYSPTSPLVDIRNATERAIVGAVEPGKNVTYYVRMTNAASWSEYTNDDGDRVAPDLKVHVDGVDPGWNVSIRPVLDQGVNDILRNPYGAEYNISNVNPGNNNRREAWFDRELEVVVQAPSIENGTAFAGAQDQISIVATTNTSADRSTLEIRTIIAELANVTVRPDETTISAHPGEPGAFLLYVGNNGSSTATVTVRAAMSSDTPATGWQVTPGADIFPLTAFKNRTVAVLVTPPAGASQGIVNVTVEYARNPVFPEQTINLSLRLTVNVVPPRSLELIAPPTREVSIGQRGTVLFNMTLRNGGTQEQAFRLTATPIPNWTVTVSPPDSGGQPLAPGATRSVTLVLVAPPDVTNNSRFATVVRVFDPNDRDNFDTVAFGVVVQGGTAIPSISVPNLVKRVDRAGVQQFEVAISNVGSTAGRIPLEVRVDPRGATADWSVGIVDRNGNNVSEVTLAPNELVNVNVTVRAPFRVDPGTAVPVEVTAYSPDLTRSSKATLRAEIHDYGVFLGLLESTKDGMPGVSTEFIVRVRNTGNENDTLNVSVNLIDLPEWTVDLSSTEVRLEPTQEVEIRARINSPTSPLPTARAYTFPFWVGTRGGQAVNITTNMTTAAVITIPNYRSHDVDRDGQLEIAVDLDKRTANGFEEFREIFSGGVNTQVVARPLFDGRTTFFLDIPAEGRPYDGVADMWFNPESVHSFEIQHFPDINDDGTPDYLIDSDRDGRIDRAFDSATERFWDALEVKVYGDDRIQYLVDITGDGRPDRFYDPETQRVTRTQGADGLGADFVGIDVDDDERVDYYYNTRTRETSGAEVQNFGGFARSYWYFFVAFAVLVLLTVILVVRRRNSP